jgi:hypothetical protein
MNEERRVSLLPGPGGWAEAAWPPGHVAYVRFALNRDKKTVRVTELRIPDPTGEALRSFPLARIETAANASAIFMVGYANGHTLPEPTDVHGHFKKIRGRLAKDQEAGRFILDRPEGRFLDDGFYIRVAKAYREAAALGLNPRQTLAKDSHAATDTVARWVGEARRRGYLPPGKPGKITA